MSPTLRDVAIAAGVSTSTVSRAFHKDRICRPVTRRKILKIASKLGYNPSPIASSLTTNSTRLIGILIDNFQNPFHMQVFEHFTNELSLHGYGCLIVNLSPSSDPEEAADRLTRYNVDGVVAVSATLPAKFVSAIKKREIPIVHAFGKGISDEQVAVVGIDDFCCGKLAAEHIHSKGYLEVASIGGPKWVSTSLDRIEGFERTCENLGLQLVSSTHAERYTYQAGADAMKSLLSKAVQPEVVFCGDDLICMGAMDAARSSGIAVPQSMGFVGVNDLNMAAWNSYQITTIRQPIDQVVRQSVSLLTSSPPLQSNQLKAHILDCNVIERLSV